MHDIQYILMKLQSNAEYQKYTIVPISLTD